MTAANKVTLLLDDGTDPLSLDKGDHLVVASVEHNSTRLKTASGEIRVVSVITLRAAPPLPDFDVRRLRLEPGDMVVLTCKTVITADKVREIKALWEENVGTAHKTVILAGLDLTILHEDEEPAQ